jgi:hypothetical protein
MDTLKTKLIGTWRLLSCVRTNQAGDTSEHLGNNAQGCITYTPDNRVTVCVMGSITTLTYTGSYSTTAGTVIHHPEFASNPAIVDVDQPRRVKFDGNRLNLTSPPGPSAVDGVDGSTTLIWERLFSK